MWCEHLWPNCCGYEPVSRNWNIADVGWVHGLFLLPAPEVDRARKGRHHDELREGDTGLEGHCDCCVEGLRLVCRQTEDERPEDMYAVFFEGLQLSREGLA